MKFEDFVKKWNGGLCNYDSYYGYQCKDYTNQYTHEMFGIESPKGNAYDVWFSDWGDYFTKYENTPDFLPVPGDICIWKIGDYGHIGMVYSATLETMQITDQNTGDGTGSGKGNNKIRTHKYDYKNVVGFIRHKSLEPKDFSKITNWKGIKVKRKDHPKSTVNAFYAKSNKTIYLTSRFITNTIVEQESILDHEAGHQLWYRLPEVIQNIWILYHEFDKDFQKVIYKKKGYKFVANNYLNYNASRTCRESFCEFIELATLDRLNGKETVFEKDNWLYIGYGIQKNIMKMIESGSIKLETV